jgi:PhnB protein
MGEVMQLIAYLTFGGQCEDAFKFYETCLRGKIEAMVTFGSVPSETQMPAAWKNKIMHARLSVGDQVLMGSDGRPGEPAAFKGFSVSVVVKDPAEADRVFAALAKNGTISMPIGETLFAVRFGMLVDQFGVPWMVNCEPAAA